MNSIAEELLDLLKQASGGIVYLAGVAKCHVSEWTEWDRKARAAIARAEAALAEPQPDSLEQARAEEREACVTLADQLWSKGPGVVMAAIRARGQK